MYVYVMYIIDIIWLHATITCFEKVPSITNNNMLRHKIMQPRCSGNVIVQCSYQLAIPLHSVHGPQAIHLVRQLKVIQCLWELCCFLAAAGRFRGCIASS